MLHALLVEKDRVAASSDRDVEHDAEVVNDGVGVVVGGGDRVSDDVVSSLNECDIEREALHSLEKEKDVDNCRLREVEVLPEILLDGNSDSERLSDRDALQDRLLE